MSSPPPPPPSDIVSRDHYSKMATWYDKERCTPPRQNPAEASILQVLLIGKSGNGKSSTGNTLLGRSLFDVSTGINACTRHTQIREATRSHKNSTFTLQVVELPDVCHEMDNNRRDEEIQRCKTLTIPNPTVIGLVVRADVRFTPTDSAICRTTLQLLGRQLREEPGQGGQGRRPSKESLAGTESTPALDNLVVIFTRGDVLPADHQKSFGEELQKANKELRQIIEDARGRYVLLSNQRRAEGDASSSVSQLMDYVLRAHHTQASEARPLHTMLLGTAGTGKSATGNTLLFPRPCSFKVQMGLSSATRSRETAVNKVAGLELKVTDTPAWNDDTPEDPVTPLITSLVSNPQHTPWLLLWVLKAHDRFHGHELRFFAALKRALGKDFMDRVLVVFTGGDLVAHSGTAKEDFLRQAPEELKLLLKDLDNSYVLVNNQATSSLERLLQRNRLLEAMQRRLDGSKGKLPRRYEKRQQVESGTTPAPRKRGSHSDRGAADSSGTSQHPTAAQNSKLTQCVLS